MTSEPYFGEARCISAPNRYRKMLPKQVDDFSASGGIHLLMAEHTQDMQDALSEALSLQKQEWPADAARALGLEPCMRTNLRDIVLLWDGVKPLASDI